MLAAFQRKRAGLLKWQRAEKRQIDGHRARQLVGNVIAVIFRMLREFEQRKHHVRRDRHVEFGLAERGHGKRAVNRTTRDFLAADAQIRGQAFDRQSPVIGIVDLQRDPKVLLQQVAADHFDTDDLQTGFVKLRREQRARGEQHRNGK